MYPHIVVLSRSLTPYKRANVLRGVLRATTHHSRKLCLRTLSSDFCIFEIPFQKKYLLLKYPNYIKSLIPALKSKMTKLTFCADEMLHLISFKTKSRPARYLVAYPSKSIMPASGQDGSGRFSSKTQGA